MITRAQMPRQLRDKGGIASVTPRENYGLGSKIKDRFRKLIPNELADIAVKAAPFVAPFNPGIAGLMRGIGRFDQRGSISDALKQGAATFGFGAATRALGGADPFGGGLKGGFTSPLDAEKTTKFKTLFERQKANIDPTKTKDKTGFLKKAAEETIGKVPVLQNLSPKVQEKLLAGTITSGASALYSFFTGEFEPQEPGETVEEYMARRRENVKSQMRQVMDSYYTPLRNPQYAAMSDEEKDNFIDGIVGQGLAAGGRVNYSDGTKPSADEAVTQQMVDQRQMAMVEDMLKKGMDISTIKSITGASDEMIQDRINFIKYGGAKVPVKKANGGMPTGIMRTNKAGVMERDYRDKGGFVPVGIKEKADDVPAMLSKNEFVFTADAVRGAGNGSIEKGAQKMYDTMKNLEKRVT
jgi:hypothetical protein